jgi:hypothetical protein
MYVRVFSLEGKMFEVTRERANKLLLQHGWTQTKPTFVEVYQPATSIEEDDFDLPPLPHERCFADSDIEDLYGAEAGADAPSSYDEDDEPLTDR